MRAHVLFGVVFVVLLGVRAAFPQAAAESVLLNSNSAAATSKAGSVLGNALNKAGSNLAGKIQTVPKSTTVSGTVTHIQTPKTQSAAATPAVSASAGGSSTSGSMITSVQGARPSRTSAPTAASSSSGGTASKTADRPTPRAPPDSSVAPK